MQFTQDLEAVCPGCGARAPGLRIDFELEPRKRGRGHKTNATHIRAIPEGWTLYYLSTPYLPEGEARYTPRCSCCPGPPVSAYGTVVVKFGSLPIDIDRRPEDQY